RWYGWRGARLRRGPRRRDAHGGDDLAAAHAELERIGEAIGAAHFAALMHAHQKRAQRVSAVRVVGYVDVNAEVGLRQVLADALVLDAGDALLRGGKVGRQFARGIAHDEVDGTVVAIVEFVFQI